MESTFTPKQNHLPLCPSPIGEASLFIVVGNRLRFSDLETGRLHSRPAALLGTVALCIRFAERWELKKTNKEKGVLSGLTCITSMGNKLLILITPLITLA